MERQKRPPFSLSETADQLNVTTRVTVRNALRRGELEGFKIGRFWRIRPESIDRVRGDLPESI